MALSPRTAALVNEDNSIFDAKYASDAVDYAHGKVGLNDPDLVRVDRIRLLTDLGFPAYDVSYVWGTLKDGRHVQVDLGTGQIAKSQRKGGKSIKASLVDLAKAAGVNAHRLHMLDSDVISILR